MLTRWTEMDGVSGRDSVGMAVGTRFYSVALIMTVFISAVMYVLSRIQFVRPLATPLVLTVHFTPGDGTAAAENVAPAGPPGAKAGHDDSGADSGGRHREDRLGQWQGGS
jgi:hypothetical protein